MYQIFIVIMMGFSTCFLSLPPIMGFMRRRGIAGRDVHKKDRLIVPEMGGITMLLGLARARNSQTGYVFAGEEEGGGGVLGSGLRWLGGGEGLR